MRLLRVAVLLLCDVLGRDNVVSISRSVIANEGSVGWQPLCIHHLHLVYRHRRLSAAGHAAVCQPWCAV